MRNRRLYVESAPPHGRQVITKHGQHGAHPTRMINRGRRPDIQRPTGMEQVEAYCGVKVRQSPGADPRRRQHRRERRLSHAARESAVSPVPRAVGTDTPAMSRHIYETEANMPHPTTDDPHAFVRSAIAAMLTKAFPGVPVYVYDEQATG